MKNNLQVLTEAREILVNGRWCQGAYARNVLGQQVNISSPKAFYWCLIGAVRLASGRQDSSALDVLGDALFNNGRGCHLAEWNDLAGRTKEEVLHLFDEAIKIAEKKEKKG